MSLKLYITGTYFACINLAALHVIIVKNQTHLGKLHGKW